MEEQINKDLSEIYFNPTNPGSYGGFQKLMRAAEGMGYTKEQVKKWMKKQDVYTLFKKVVRKFPTPRVVVPSKNYQWDMDTVNMSSYIEENKKHAYILVIIDIFTRYLMTVPLFTLTGKEVSEVLRKIFSKTKPIHCRTDRGTEFCNNLVKKVFQDFNVDHMRTSNHTKANFSERCIKTIKTVITRHMYHYQDHNWIDILPQITESYNKTFHSSIKMSPLQALEADSVTLWNNQYEHLRKFKRSRPNKLQSDFRFQLNDSIRISKMQKQFERAYHQKWTDEIFLIAGRERQQGIPMYRIKAWNNELIDGKFYENELQKIDIDESTVYKIEKIIKKKKVGKKDGYVVKWLGWGQEYNSWVSANEIKDIKKFSKTYT